MYYKLLILIAIYITFINTKELDEKWAPIFPIYGTYCGLHHSNKYGEKPVDELDRYCQYHDICVTALGLSNCQCNEQLYFLVSNLKPKNITISEVKKSILYYLYVCIWHCQNYYDFDITFWIPSIMKSNGFNYLPIYPKLNNNNNYEINYNNNNTNNQIYIYSLPNSVYNNFTIDVYDDPENIYKYHHYLIKKLDNDKFYFTVNNIIVIYNPSFENQIVVIKSLCN